MSNLKDFIENRMRMSHIYQPVMIKALLENGGLAHKRTIALNLLTYDFSQLEYYENVTNNMVGKVLRKNEIVTRQKNVYLLNDFEELSEAEIQELIALCDFKITDFLQKRGDRIWEHRRKNRKAVPGSVRYRVLSRARGRCELCGISKEEKALEVDHIVPKNLGGADSIDNYQALCYTCNANKRDTDSTDFREMEAVYEKRQPDCVFCDKNQNVIEQNELALAFYDKYPVTEKHVLIIPKRHCPDYFFLTQPEINAMHRLAHSIQAKLLESDENISGFNIGYNVGEDAGQTVFHCHMHLIPRRKGDMQNPRGGVRHSVAGKGYY